MTTKKISSKTVSRVLLYIRTLESFAKTDKQMISSGELARITGLTDVQIRKDISSFGKVGTPRLGYDVAELRGVLADFVFRKNVIRAVLFGVGNLGTAILRYTGFKKQHFEIVAAFDKDERKIDKSVNGVKIYPVKKAECVIKKSHVDIGIIAVPPECSQGVADLIALSGVKGIVNFAPTHIQATGKLKVRNIDLCIEFMSLYCDTCMSEAGLREQGKNCEPGRVRRVR